MQTWKVSLKFMIVKLPQNLVPTTHDQASDAAPKSEGE